MVQTMDKTMDSNGGEGWLWVVVSDKEEEGHYLGL
jgi:hypothetical protein